MKPPSCSASKAGPHEVLEPRAVTVPRARVVRRLAKRPNPRASRAPPAATAATDSNLPWVFPGSRHARSAPNGAAVSSQGLAAPGTRTQTTRPTPHATAPNGVAVSSQGASPWYARAITLEPNAALNRAEVPCRSARQITPPEALLFRFVRWGKVLDQRHLVTRLVVAELVDQAPGQHDAESPFAQAELVPDLDVANRVVVGSRVR